MIQIAFSDNQIKTLAYERYYHPHPRVQRKMEALLLKSQGLSHELICQIAGISGNTFRRYLKAYIEGGLVKLKEINFYRQPSELLEHKGTIEEYFREHPPASIKEAIAKIEELTGIKRSPTQTRKFLKSIGMRILKVGVIPSKADPDEQETFKKEELEPRLEEAKSGKRVVLFVDAAHFVLAPFLGFLWCFTRVFIKSPSGRKRFNVLGALNAITHELITFANDSYINAYSFCDLLWDISRRYTNIPITLVLDNARYQKCALVFYFARFLDIELLYLPAYSPNLNLIERLWKFVKKTCLYSKYYEDFGAFKGAISNCLNETHTTHKKALDTLLSLRFQTFTKEQILSP
jgi:transposase